jgi:hypothetical protein
LTKNTKKGVSFCYGSDRAKKENTVKIVVYYLVLMVVLILSFALQLLSPAWGYTLGILGVIITFTVAVNELAKEIRK